MAVFADSFTAGAFQCLTTGQEVLSALDEHLLNNLHFSESEMALMVGKLCLDGSYFSASL